ncbi:MAG: 2,4-diaminopentanoate dehydrogenase [Clostridium sp.]
MAKEVRVVLWGLGIMGQGMARMLSNKKGFQIVGAIDLDDKKVGRKLYDVIGVEKSCINDITIVNKPDEVIKKGLADIVMIATSSFTKSVYAQIKFSIENKINVITTAEEMSYPKINDPELSEDMDKLAKENGVSILGTGINPGFIMDYLVLALTGVCEDVTKIKVARVNDLSCFGMAVMEEQGIGLTKDEFITGVNEDRIAGHVGFMQSFGMFEEALNIKLDKVEQTKEPIITNVDRATELVSVKAGNVAGCKQMGYGYIGDKVFIEMEHPQQIKPELENLGTGDYINIEGKPNINLKNTPEIAGGIGTYAICVNMIPHVINSTPGLKTMLDLPIPVAILGDVRDLIKNR